MSVAVSVVELFPRSLCSFWPRFDAEPRSGRRDDERLARLFGQTLCPSQVLGPCMRLCSSMRLCVWLSAATRAVRLQSAHLSSADGTGKSRESPGESLPVGAFFASPRRLLTRFVASSLSPWPVPRVRILSSALVVPPLLLNPRPLVSPPAPPVSRAPLPPLMPLLPAAPPVPSFRLFCRRRWPPSPLPPLVAPLLLLLLLRPVMSLRTSCRCVYAPPWTEPPSSPLALRRRPLHSLALRRLCVLAFQTSCALSSRVMS